MATSSLPAGEAATFDLDLSVVFGNQGGTIKIWEATRDETWSRLLGSLLKPGDRVLTSRHGDDSSRLVTTAERVGLDVVSCDVPAGEGIPLSMFSHLLWWDSSIKAVLVTQEESSTGVRNDVAKARRVLDETGSTARLLVDTTPLGAVGFRQDEWAVDAVVCGSAPLEAGSIAILSSNKSADLDLFPPEVADLARLGDLRSLVGAEVWLTELTSDQARLQDAWLAEGVRRGLASLGLRLCVPDPQWISDSITVYELPEGVDRNQVAASAFESFGGGAWDSDEALAPDQVRLDHRRLRTEKACMAAVAAMELALLHGPTRVEPGAGIGAALSWFADTSPSAPA